MKFVKQSYEIMDELDGEQILKKLERCGRVCYKSVSDNTMETAKKFVGNLIKRGHESVLEHVSFTVKFVTDRGVTHELVRHRLASYSQESTRYCDYGKADMEFIAPMGMTKEAVEVYMADDLRGLELAYECLRGSNYSPQLARDILPTCLKTEIVVSANLREWRHIFKYRVQGVTGAPHPKIKALLLPLLRELKERVPVVFDDITED